MVDIVTQGNTAFRNYVTDGVPETGANNPSKTQIRSFASIIGRDLYGTSALTIGPVSTVADLIAAIGTAPSRSTILVADGVYTASSTIPIISKGDIKIAAVNPGLVDINALILVYNCGRVRFEGIHWFQETTGNAGAIITGWNATVILQNCSSLVTGIGPLFKGDNAGNINLVLDCDNDTRDNLYDHSASTGEDVFLGEGCISLIERGAKISVNDDDSAPWEDFRHRIVILEPPNCRGGTYVLRNSGDYGRNYTHIGDGTGTGKHITRGSMGYGHTYVVPPATPTLTFRDPGYVFPGSDAGHAALTGATKTGLFDFETGISLGANARFAIGTDEDDQGVAGTMGVFSFDGCANGVKMDGGSSFAFLPGSVDFSGVTSRAIHAPDVHAGYWTDTLAAFRTNGNAYPTGHAQLVGHWILGDTGFATVSELYEQNAALTWVRKTGGLVKTITDATYTVLRGDATLVINRAGTVTLTMPDPTLYIGHKPIRIKTIQAQLVVSNASNVVPLAGGAASADMLAATPGKWIDVEVNSAGTAWEIMAGN